MGALPHRLALAAVLCLAVSAAHAGLQESASFRSAPSGYGQGGALGRSLSFASAGTVQDIGSQARDSAGFKVRAGFEAALPQPHVVTDLAVAQVGVSSISLRWSAPAADAERSTGTPVRYLLRYSTTGPIDSDAAFSAATDFAPGVPLAPGTTETIWVPGIDASLTIYFSIEAVNEHGVRAPRSPSAASFAVVFGPMAPFGIRLAVGDDSATLSWLPVGHLENRTAFADPSAPTPTELNAYRVYRATSPRRAVWQEVAFLSTGTLSFTDAAASGSDFYYRLQAENANKVSPPSVVRGMSAEDAWVLTPDEKSAIRIPANLVDPIEGVTGAAYRVEAATRAADIEDRVLASVEITAYRDGTEPVERFELDGMGALQLHFEKEGSFITPASQPEPTRMDQASVYWYDGRKWVQLFGKADAFGQVMTIETKYLGRYQIRSVERPTGFSFDSSGISNKFLTPNGDGLNDSVVVTFNNPRDSAVSGTIFDLKGAHVATMRPGPVRDSLLWDGMAAGQVVPGGVYLYQLEAEERRFNGTIVVVK